MKVKRAVKGSAIGVVWYVEKNDADILVGYNDALEKAAILDGYKPDDVNLAEWGYQSIEVFYQKVDWVDVSMDELENPVEITYNEWVLRGKPDASKRREVYYE